MCTPSVVAGLSTSKRRSHFELAVVVVVVVEGSGDIGCSCML